MIWVYFTYSTTPLGWLTRMTQYKDKAGLGVSKNEKLCIENEELCIKNEELYVKNEKFCRAPQRCLVVKMLILY